LPGQDVHHSREGLHLSPIFQTSVKLRFNKQKQNHGSGLSFSDIPPIASSFSPHLHEHPSPQEE